MTVAVARTATPRDRAGGAVDPARHIDGDHGKPALVHRPRLARQGSPSIGRASPAPNNASTTTSALARRSGMQRLDSTRPELRHRCRIRRQARRIAVEAEANRIAFVEQMARGDEAVAAIVAWAAQHADAARIGKEPATTSSATARPAFSMSMRPGTPPSMARRSACPISSAVSSSSIVRRYRKAPTKMKTAHPEAAAEILCMGPKS